MASASIRTAVLVAALVAGAVAGPVEAEHGTGIRFAERAGEPELISRDRAAEIARSATGGRVLRVELRGDGRPWYRVRVLVDGERVTTLAVDARSGRLRD